MDLTKYFEKGIENNKSFQEAFKIVQTNSLGGNFWIMGGAVYRSIVKSLYKVSGEEIFDFDFIVEKPVPLKNIKLPSGWKLTQTGLGEPRFVKGNKQIDFVYLDNAINPSESSKLSTMNTAQKIESYFRHAPLTVQAIVYDVGAKRIIGDLGVKAIKKKVIRVNNLDECIGFCKRRKISIREFIGIKMKSLGFSAVFPDFDSDKKKKKTEEFYDKHVKEYEQREDYSNFLNTHLREEMELFVKKLKGKKILDLGSGPGRDALYFKQIGLYPVCVDVSLSMVKACKMKGLRAFKKDMENLDFKNESFDGVFAYTSLVHIPKQRIYNVIARIRELLKPNGILFVGIVEGKGEIMYKGSTGPSQQRFFARYGDTEFQEILRDYFTIVASKRFKLFEKQIYLNYICVKVK